MRVGIAYANVPPLNLRAGDKLAFDTSFYGSASLTLQLSLGTCRTWRTIEADNSETNLPYICEDEYLPVSKMKSVFSGAVVATKPRNGTDATAAHEYEELWYELVLELQEEYCHTGGTLIVMLSDVSDPTFFQKLTTSPVDETLQAVMTLSADGTVLEGGWTSVQRDEVPVMRILPDYSLLRKDTMYTEHTNVVAGVLSPYGDWALYAQTGSSSEQQSSKLIKIATETGLEQVDAATVSDDWFTSAVADQSGDNLYLGTVSRPAKMLRVDPVAVSTESMRVLDFETSMGEITFLVHEGDFIYVGVNSFPAQILRVNVADNATDTIILGVHEILPKCADIDRDTGMLVVGLLGTFPGRILLISLATFERYCGHSLSATQEGILTMSIDPVFGNLYVGVNSAPAKIVRMRLTDLYSFKAIGGTAQIMQELIPDMHPIAWDTASGEWDEVAAGRADGNAAGEHLRAPYRSEVVGGFIHDGAFLSTGRVPSAS
jgi:hypothetical protein